MPHPDTHGQPGDILIVDINQDLRPVTQNHLTKCDWLRAAVEQARRALPILRSRMITSGCNAWRTYHSFPGWVQPQLDQRIKSYVTIRHFAATDMQRSMLSRSGNGGLTADSPLRPSVAGAALSHPSLA
jgi:hypothetical protein